MWQHLFGRRALLPTMWAAQDFIARSKGHEAHEEFGTMSGFLEETTTCSRPALARRSPTRFPEVRRVLVATCWFVGGNDPGDVVLFVFLELVPFLGWFQRKKHRRRPGGVPHFKTHPCPFRMELSCVVPFVSPKGRHEVLQRDTGAHHRTIMPVDQPNRTCQRGENKSNGAVQYPHQGKSSWFMAQFVRK